MTDAMGPETAKGIIARRIIWQSVQRADVEDQRENHPEIGEYDWDDIVAKIDNLVNRQNPSNDEYQAAYALLESRAVHG